MPGNFIDAADAADHDANAVNGMPIVTTNRGVQLLLSFARAMASPYASFRDSAGGKMRGPHRLFSRKLSKLNKIGFPFFGTTLKVSHSLSFSGERCIRTGPALETKNHYLSLPFITFLEK